MNKLLVTWCAIACAAMSGCGKDSGPKTVNYPREVSVAAAADLKFAFDDIAAAFEKKNPDIKVKATYGSSGNLFAQLENKAPFDLFLSADIDYPRKLIDQGHAPKNSEFLYAVGHIVVWARESSPLDVEKLGLECLLDPGVKTIAIANPRFAPFGRAAEAALKKTKIYEKIQDKLVLGDNITQTAQFVETGAADVGIIALSLARAPAMKGKGKFREVPPDAYPPLIQGGIVLSWARDRSATELVRQFLLSPEGEEVLKRYGFSLELIPKRIQDP